MIELWRSCDFFSCSSSSFFYSSFDLSIGEGDFEIDLVFLPGWDLRCTEMAR